MTQEERLWIGGEWVAPEGGHYDVVNPATEEIVGRAPQASVDQARAAAAAARDGFAVWSRSTPEQRAAVLDRAATLLTEQADEIVPLAQAETGATPSTVTALQLGVTVARFRRYSRGAYEPTEIPLVPQVTESTALAKGGLTGALAVRQPVGVVTCITSYNNPLANTAGKVAPALAMGNGVVVKPAPQNPLAVYRMAAALHEAGLPHGVFNVVTGAGPEVGEAVVESPDVDMISFTGSTTVGTRIAEVAARSMKRTLMELGGKGAAVVFDDADLASAVGGIGTTFSFYSGQICTAPTRVIAQRGIYEQLVEELAGYARALVVGDPTVPGTVVGPVISAAHRDRVEGYVKTGQHEGAELVTGGERPPFERGFYVAPALFTGCTSGMRIVQEEIFGPVVVVVPFDDEDEGIALANDSVYGLIDYVGIGITERSLRARYGADVCDHHVFAICSDGDLEEGVSHEAASLAGHLGLGNLVYVYDDNHISIDGPTDLAYSDNVPQRFEAYGWHVVQLGEAAEDLDALEAGLREGMAERERPSLVVLRSHIGYPSPKYTDTAHAHGNPLGADEVAAVKRILELPEDDFWVPEDVLGFYRAAGSRGRAARDAWADRVEKHTAEDPARAADFRLCLAGAGRDGWTGRLPVWTEAGEQIATRSASVDVVDTLIEDFPAMLGGGADLTGNTGTELKGNAPIEKDDFSGRQLHFGVREHGMGSVMNGMALTGGALPFGGTFLVFSDYMRAAPRLAALSRAKVAFVWSHDSVGLGEDGPTHQPIEHVMSLRAIPGLTLIRPADANETAHAWRQHLEGDGPTAIILTRQKVPVLAGTDELAAAGVAAGAYTLVAEGEDGLDLVLIGTGSEVQLCVGAAEQLTSDGVSARVVSMPSWELFAEQDGTYRDSVLPPGVPTLAVEAGVSLGWERYADDSVSIDHFGASAPGGVALAEFGFTVENVTERARALLGR